MRILFATSEVATVFKLGGLGDVSYALPAALRRHKVHIEIALPYFAKAKIKHPVCLGPLAVSFDRKRELVFIFAAKLGDTGVPLILFRHPMLDEYKGTKEIDIVTRFAFFSHAVATYCVAQALQGKRYDLIHCNDWHTALIPLLLGDSPKVFFRYANHHHLHLGQEKTLTADVVRTVLTIHNPSYHGIASTSLVRKIALDSRQFHVLKDGSDRYINLLREGLEYADTITTVSPTFAREMLFDNYGPHVTSILRARKDHLLGILNGIDETLWDPKHDAHLPYRYNKDNVIPVKMKLKAHLVHSLRLPQADVPLFGFVGRLDKRQKGLDILLEAVEILCKAKQIQFVMLGTGAPTVVKLIENVQKKYPGSFVFTHTFDERLARRIYAGSDILLVPSKYEPCGLTQMIAMRYGTIPLVRKTGGLADSVKDGKTGFVFGPYTMTALVKKMREAIRVFQKDPKTWKAMIARAMREDFSWKRSAKEYLALYRRLLYTH